MIQYPTTESMFQDLGPKTIDPVASKENPSASHMNVFIRVSYSLPSAAGLATQFVHNMRLCVCIVLSFVHNPFQHLKHWPSWTKVFRRVTISTNLSVEDLQDQRYCFPMEIPAAALQI